VWVSFQADKVKSAINKEEEAKNRILPDWNLRELPITIYHMSMAHYTPEKTEYWGKFLKFIFLRFDLAKGYLHCRIFVQCTYSIDQYLRYKW
jgi:hypothetical protein